MSLLGLFFTIGMGILTLRLPRRHAAVPLLVVACCIPLQVKVMIGDLDFYMIRIMILFCWARLFLKQEIAGLQLNTIDYLMIFWGICNTILFTLSHDDPGAFTNRLGFLMNTFGTYFFFRCVVRDIEDIGFLIYCLAFIVIPIGFFILFENITGHNVFGEIWGVSWKVIIRKGELRCLGPFASSILAGTFGATAVPLFVSLWLDRKTRPLSIAAWIGSILIIVSSSSVGPIMSLIVGIFALFMWYFRSNLRLIRWGFVIALVFLHLIMKAPVWYLMSRISGYVGGGTGWHRSELITQSIKHFNEWWLMGTDYTAHWMPYALPSNPDMTDITNQYLVQGVHGGVLTMALFIAVIWYSFKFIGKALDQVEGRNLHKQLMVWSIGASLFAHCVTFMSVSYFDQIIVIFYMLLAFSSALNIQTAEDLGPSSDTASMSKVSS